MLRGQREPLLRSGRAAPRRPTAAGSCGGRRAWLHSPAGAQASRLPTLGSVLRVSEHIDKSKLGFSSRAIHAGYEPDPTTGAVIPPIYATSTYKQDGVGGLRGGYEYSRSANPTRTALEGCIAALEEGSHGFAFASGLAAEDTLLRVALPPRRPRRDPDDAYGGSFRLFDKVESPWGLDHTTAQVADVDAVAAAIEPGRTKVVWVETPTNPMLNIADIAALADVAHQAGALLVVDNTFASPYLQQPLTLGADVVVHSTTKYCGGHSDVVGGALVVRDGDLAEKLLFHQNAIGGVAGPFDSWLVLRGLKTLALRMERHCDNAEAVVAHLAEHPGVSEVVYPGLASHPGHEVAGRQMKRYGGIVSFRVAAGEQKALEVCGSTQVWTLGESLGGVESLIEHPGRMTHASVAGHPARGPRGPDPAVGRDRGRRRPHRGPRPSPGVTPARVAARPGTRVTIRHEGDSAVDEVVVCVDFGSTFTKAALVDLHEGRLAAKAEHRTTVDTDVHRRVRRVPRVADRPGPARRRRPRARLLLGRRRPADRRGRQRAAGHRRGRPAGGAVERGTGGPRLGRRPRRGRRRCAARGPPGRRPADRRHRRRQQRGPPRLCLRPGGRALDGPRRGRRQRRRPARGGRDARRRRDAVRPGRQRRAADRGPRAGVGPRGDPGDVPAPRDRRQAPLGEPDVRRRWSGEPPPTWCSPPSSCSPPGSTPTGRAPATWSSSTWAGRRPTSTRWWSRSRTSGTRTRRSSQGLSREVVAVSAVNRTVEGDLGMRWSAVSAVEEAHAAGLVDEASVADDRAAAERRRDDPAFLPSDPERAGVRRAARVAGGRCRAPAARGTRPGEVRERGRSDRPLGRAQRRRPPRGGAPHRLGGRAPARRGGSRPPPRPRLRRRRVAGPGGARGWSSTPTTCWPRPACSPSGTRRRRTGCSRCSADARLPHTLARWRALSRPPSHPRSNPPRGSCAGGSGAAS